MAKKKVAKKKVAKKKVAKGKKAKSSCANKEVLVVASKVKAYIRSKGYMCGSDAIGKLSCNIYCMMDAAMERATANRRSTVKAQDVSWQSPDIRRVFEMAVGPDR